MAGNGKRRISELSREEAVELARRMRVEVGRPISGKEFLERAGLSYHWLGCRFPGNWTELRELAGIEPHPTTVSRYSDEDLLAEFHRTALAVGRLPRWQDLRRGLARVSSATFSHRWGRMRTVLERYREWLEAREPESPLLEAVRAAEAKRPRRAKRAREGTVLNSSGQGSSSRDGATRSVVPRGGDGTTRSVVPLLAGEGGGAVWGAAGL